MSSFVISVDYHIRYYTMKISDQNYSNNDVKLPSNSKALMYIHIYILSLSLSLSLSHTHTHIYIYIYKIGKHLIFRL